MSTLNVWHCRFKINPGNLSRGLVSCTGAQFCGVAIIETKNRAKAMIEKLEEQLDVPEPVRIHWTGCPNSCGQVHPHPQPPFPLWCFPMLILTSSYPCPSVMTY